MRESSKGHTPCCCYRKRIYIIKKEYAVNHFQHNYTFVPQTGFSLSENKAGRDMPWPRSWGLSALCPLWPRLQTLSALSKPCPPSVFPLCSPPPSLVLVRLQSAMAGPALPNLVCHVSALCVLWLPLQTLAGMCRASASHCIRLVSALAASERCVSHVALCVHYVFAPCVFFVLSLYARCSRFLRSLLLFGQVYGLALAGALSALCSLFGFCAFVCSVSVIVGPGRYGYAFARCSSGHL